MSVLLGYLIQWHLRYWDPYGHSVYYRTFTEQYNELVSAPIEHVACGEKPGNLNVSGGFGGGGGKGSKASSTGLTGKTGEVYLGSGWRF